MVKYYPPESELDIARIIREHPELEMVNAKEEVRLADLADRKKRGKAPPTKTKNKGELNDDFGFEFGVLKYMFFCTR
jgi:Mitochondrial ribosomal subunit S27